MKEIKVSTQAEYDEVKDQEDVQIVIEQGSITISGSASVYARDSARVYAYGSASVDAYGSARVDAYGSARVDARGSARVDAYGSARVDAYGSARVDARDSARVDARGSASVYARDSASVDARDSARVDAYGSASVYARGSASVYARDSARVDAYDSASVYAYGSASVYAYDSARVYARDSARVDAYGSASVYAYGLANAVINATPFAVVMKMPYSQAQISAAIVIVKPDLGSESVTAETWAAYYGATISEDRKLTVYKGVGPQLVSQHGTEYPIGGEASAADWAPTRTCGAGLHFSPTPRQTNEYHSFGDDARYLVCEVDADQAVVLDDKIKAPSCRVLYEVDQRGDKIEQKEEASA